MYEHICCGSPATCHSTHACFTREDFRETAKIIGESQVFESAFTAAQSSVQGQINDATSGSCTFTSVIGELVGPAMEAAVGAIETDPSGLAKNAPGAKLDAGKVRVGLVMGGFARALMEVSKVGTAGANKYTPNGWMEVPNGIERYTDARDRHQLKEYMGEEIDPDFGLLHAAHEAWNSLARLDLMLRAKEGLSS